MRGKISTEQTIWCGCECGCMEWIQHSSGLAIDFAKESGWRLKRKNGWHCRDCVRKRWPCGLSNEDIVPF